MMKCSNCDYEDFQEENGFYYCQRCNHQCEGVQLQVVDNEEAPTVLTREVGRKRSKLSDKNRSNKRAPGGKNKERKLFSKYTDVEAQVCFFIGIVEDFVNICLKFHPEFDAINFTRFAYKLMIKFLRESEIAYARDEKINSVVKLYPKKTFRDRCLINQNIDNIDHLPFFQTFQNRNVEKDDLVKVSARTYRLARRCKQNTNYYESQENFKDSRLRDLGKRNTRVKSGKFETVKMFKKLLTTQDDHEDDRVARIVERAKNQQNSGDINDDISEEENIKSDTEIENDNNDENEENEEELKKKQNQELLEQMPKRLKLLFPDKPIDFFSNRSGDTLKTIDVLDERKSIAILFSAIRQWNIGIFFGDINRWINDDVIRLRHCFDWLPNNYEVNMKSLQYYRSAPALSRLNLIYRCTNFHLTLAGHEDIHDTVMMLVERLLYDLNLPKGLFLLINLNYSHYTKKVYEQKFCKVFFNPPKYEHFAITLIVLTLRDLFSFDKCMQKSWNVPEKIDNLFDLQAWFKYSQIRLNSIKSHLSDIPNLNNNDIIDPVDVHFALRRETKYLLRHKKQFITAGFQLKPRDMDNRSQLREQYEFVFGDENYTRIDQALENKTLHEASLYPLTSYSDYITKNCQNSYLKSILKQDFRQTLITPYFFWNNDYFLKKKKNWIHKIGHIEYNKLPGWLKNQHPIVRHFFNDITPIYIQTSMECDRFSLSYYTNIDRFF